MRIGVRILPTALAVLMCADTLAAQQPGRLVIIGGGLDRDNVDVYRAILDGRHGSGPLCIVPTASAEPDSAIAWPVASFEQHGGPGTAVGVVIDVRRPETAHDSAAVRQIRACSGFYFTGGDQARIVGAFIQAAGPTPVFRALRDRHREGAVVAGSSAGAAMMSDPMIGGGSSAGALMAGVRRNEGDGNGVIIGPGLGFFPAGLTDQHFLARGRFGRLAVAIADPAIVDLGFGIDENTALIVDGDMLSTAGTSGVVVLDARDAVQTAEGITGVTLDLMSEGDRYDLRTRRLTIDPAKHPLAPQAALHETANAFARWELLHVLQKFAARDEASVTAPVEGGEIRLRKLPGFAAASRGTAGVQGTSAGMSITGIGLDLLRGPARIPVRKDGEPSRELK